MPEPTARPSRRSVLRAGSTLTLAGAAVTVLGGCAGGDSTQASNAATAVGSLSADTLDKVSAAITANEVGVGKAKILSEVGLIVSQPTAGSYVVFRNTCTHQGGKVSEITQSGRLRCPLHGSEFDAASGEAKVGPAEKPLPATKLSVKDGKVTTA